MGGATISFINMLLGLKDKGIEPIIVVPKSSIDSGFLEFVEHHHIEVYQLDLALSFYRTPQKISDAFRTCKGIAATFINKIRGYIQLLRLCKKINPDIIHTNVGVIHEGFHVAKKLDIPHVWHLREYQKLDFNMNIIPSYKYFCRLLQESYVITITKDIGKYFRLDNYAKSQTIYNGIFSKRDIFFDENKENYFLCASRISPEKGHHDVVKAFGEYCKLYNNCELYIAGFGDDNYIEELKRIAAEYNCLEKVRFLGFKKDIKPLMKKAKALIVGSYNEGFGRMTAEAFFCGCTVIGRNSGGTKEILDEIGGLKFENNEELLNHMIFVNGLHLDEYKNHMLSSQQKAGSLYSIENNVQKVFELYKRISKPDHNLKD